MANRSHSVKTSLDLVGKEGERGGKQNKNQKLFSWHQQKIFPWTTLSSCCIFLKFYSLQAAQMLTRRAWQQKCLERKKPQLLFFPPQWQSSSVSTHNDHTSGDWKREDNTAPTFVPAKDNRADIEVWAEPHMRASKTLI